MCPFATASTSSPGLESDWRVLLATTQISFQDFPCPALTHLQARQRIGVTTLSNRLRCSFHHAGRQALLTRLVYTTPPSFRWRDAPDRATHTLNSLARPERRQFTRKLRYDRDGNVRLPRHFTLSVTLTTTVIVPQSTHYLLRFWCCDRQSDVEYKVLRFLFVLSQSSSRQSPVRHHRGLRPGAFQSALPFASPL
jgi:hypothetical protein